MSYEELAERSRATQVRAVPMSQVDWGTGDFGSGQVPTARFDDLVVPVTSESRDILAGAYHVPRDFMEQLHPETQVAVLRDRSRVYEETLHWGVNTGDDAGDVSTNALEFWGPISKPVVPFNLIGDLFRHGGFEIEGTRERGGTGVITATSTIEGMIEPREGDITRSGVRIQHDPGMRTNTITTPYSYRLICLNGMTTTVERPRMNVVGHDVDSVLSQIEEIAESAFRQAESLNQLFASLDDHPANIESTVRDICIAYRIPASLRNRMLQEAQRLARLGSGHTLYDALNIITQISTHEISDPSRRLNMQAVAGRVAEDGQLNCSRCGSNLS